MYSGGGTYERPFCCCAAVGLADVERRLHIARIAVPERAALADLYLWGAEVSSQTRDDGWWPPEQCEIAYRAREVVFVFRYDHLDAGYAFEPERHEGGERGRVVREGSCRGVLVMFRRCRD